jgi:hypothetical protein
MGQAWRIGAAFFGINYATGLPGDGVNGIFEALRTKQERIRVERSFERPETRGQRHETRDTVSCLLSHVSGLRQKGESAMSQPSDNILQEIESTREALGEKLDLLDTKVREKFDLHYYMAIRPWQILGAAVAAGFAIGRWRGSRAAEEWPESVQYATPRPWPGTADGMLKMIAISLAVNMLSDIARAYAARLIQRFGWAVAP